AGISTYGVEAPTSAPPGIGHVSSRGSSGTRQANSAAVATASGTPLLPNRRSPLEGRGGRPPRAALSRLERVSGYAMAGLAELLGPTEPAGHQSGRSHAEICRRGARPKHQALADGEGFRSQRITSQPNRQTPSSSRS